MILSLQSPIFSLHGEESGVKWGGGQKKRGLTSLIKSRLVYAIGRYQSWWRKRKRMWSKGQCSQVQMWWWWWGGGILRGLQDVFSDGLHLKRGAFTFCSPSSLKSQHRLLLLSLLSSTPISQKRIQHSLKCSQDGSHLINLGWLLWVLWTQMLPVFTNVNSGDIF